MLQYAAKGDIQIKRFKIMNAMLQSLRDGKIPAYEETRIIRTWHIRGHVSKNPVDLPFICQGFQHFVGHNFCTQR
jgi:hypothetical protein